MWFNYTKCTRIDRFDVYTYHYRFDFFWWLKFYCCDCDLTIGRILWVVDCWSSLVAALADDVDDDDDIGSIEDRFSSHY